MANVKYSPMNRQFLDQSGNPAAGHRLTSYAAGSSSLLPTYADSTGAAPNPNPIILDTLGYPPNQIWQTAGLEYQFMLADENGVDYRTEDNIPGINDANVTTSQWQASGVTPAYVSATSFSVPGDQTSEFHAGRRVQLTVTAGTVYGRITASAFTTLTTVTVSLDSGALDSGLSAVSLSILRADHHSLPTVPKASFGTNDGTIASASFVQDAVFAVTAKKNLSVNGYQELSNGFIMQWCHVTSAGSLAGGAGATIGFSFPEPFPTAVLYARADLDQATYGLGGTAYVNPVNKTGGTVNLYNVQGNATWGSLGALVFAIGY